MNKNKNYLKLQEILERDRLNIADDFFTLLTLDEKKLLSEYLDVIGEPKITLEKKSGEMVLTVKVSASRVKNVLLPNKI